MSLKGLLRHTCTIKSKLDTTDRLGESDKTYEATGTTLVQCFFQAKTVEKLTDERAELLAVDKYTIFFNPSQTIKIGDKVESIKNSVGDDIVSGTWFVETVAVKATPKKNHHLTVGLRR